MAILDADVILASFRTTLPGIAISEKAVRAAIQHARSEAKWPLEEPAAVFFAFSCRPRAMPALGAKLAVFMARQQLERLGLTLSATDHELAALRMQIIDRRATHADVVAWFAERIPEE